MNEVFCDNLRTAIVKQAVDDYMKCAKEIMRLKDNKQKFIIDLIVRDSKLKKPYGYTYHTADEERLIRIQRLKSEMKEIEHFFLGGYFRKLFSIDGGFMVKKIREKAKYSHNIDCDLL